MEQNANTMLTALSNKPYSSEETFLLTDLGVKIPCLKTQLRCDSLGNVLCSHIRGKLCGVLCDLEKQGKLHEEDTTDCLINGQTVNIPDVGETELSVKRGTCEGDFAFSMMYYRI